MTAADLAGRAVQMSRTNIEIDDLLIATAMRMHGLRMKREAVDFALRSLLGGEPMTLEETLDCVLAAVAMRSGAAVLARDGDFEAIARHVELELA